MRRRWALAAMLLSLPALATRSRTWTDTAAGLAAGRAEGLAVSARGRLFPAPRLTRLAPGQLPNEPAQVWSVAADGAGNVYLGTSPNGKILRIGSNGRASVFYSIDEPLVTALARTPDGELLAGGSPGGRIYRIKPDGKGALWSETDQRYLWALTVAADGQVYAATGESGAVYRIDRSGEPTRLYAAAEAHIVTLRLDGARGLLAGGAGRGLVYRIDRDGRTVVLYDDDLPEVVAVLPGGNGQVIAALVAAAEDEGRRAAVRIRIPETAQVGANQPTLPTLEERETASLRGTIEGLQREPGRSGPAVRGRVVRIAADGRTSELWTSDSESPFDLLDDAEGRTLIATGEPAGLYRVELDGDVARLFTLREAQASALWRSGRSLLLATSNPVALYRTEESPAEAGDFISRSIDAGGPARWGRMRWEVAREGGVELATRSGNSGEPDASWSAWSPALIDPTGSAIASPPGRFLQWRARLHAGAGGGPVLSAVQLAYAPLNRPPRLEDLRLDPPRAAVSHEATLRVRACDPDRDPLALTVEARPTGGGWTDGPTTALDAPECGGVTLDDQRLTWSAEGLPEGDYELRVGASDQGANPDGEGVRVLAEPVLYLAVDRSPPELTLSSRQGTTLEVIVRDAHSDVTRLSVADARGERFSPRPQDGVCDSRVERFRIELPDEPAGGGWVLRGADAAGNVGELPVPPR